MALTLYNTLTRRKEPFRPIDPSKVRMYVCGPTVYDYAHIGNARPVIVFDVLFRLLRHIYGPEHVTYARNITDVDDKINARAAEEGVPIRELTERTAKQFHEDIAALGVLPPTVEPRATEHIPEMRALIETLIERGNAYVAEDHVLFDVGSMPDYGRLSNRSLTEMEAGARVDVAPYKRGPMDFVLWKPSKPSEPSWPSPAGIAAPGRPGWHIECSAMAEKHLGRVFDIHGGGIDLVFPHHENEIAQSRCAHGTPVMANYWLHNGFLNVEDEKMSKSLGNFVTIRELLSSEAFGGRSWPGEVLRLAMLKTHYRQPIDWTVGALKETHKELQVWANALANTEGMYFSIGQRHLGNLPRPATEVVAALFDDLNTPQALTELRSLFSRYKEGDSQSSISLMETLEFLGLLRAEKLFVHNQYHVGSGKKLISSELRHYLDEIQVAVANGREERKQELMEKMLARGVSVATNENGSVTYEVVGDESNSLDIKVEQLLAARSAARKSKDFKEADRIRDELAAMGIQLKDAKDPATGKITTTWEIKR